MTLRIAMWSGPRNLSTALMRAFQNRPDCAVTDEPLYACYLSRTGLTHPGSDEVLASQSTDALEVTRSLCGPGPFGAPIWYQKHMTHHLLPGMDGEWLGALTHCFLIREPQRVAASYARRRSEMTLADLGYAQQVDIYHRMARAQGYPPLVMSAEDLLADPRRTLTALCERLGIPFLESMLTWPAGPRPSDGVWGKYWYASVEHSTGFAPSQETFEAVPPHLQAIAAAAEPYYRELHALRL